MWEEEPVLCSAYLSACEMNTFSLKQAVNVLLRLTWRQRRDPRVDRSDLNLLFYPETTSLKPDVENKRS